MYVLSFFKNGDIIQGNTVCSTHSPKMSTEIVQLLMHPVRQTFLALYFIVIIDYLTNLDLVGILGDEMHPR